MDTHRRRACIRAAAGSAFLLAAGPAQAAGKLSLSPDWPITLAIAIAFLLLIVPLNNLLFKPLFAVLDEREERIDGARRRAAQLQAEAQAVLERYEGAVREVREDSERDRRSRIDEARSEQAGITAEARSQAEAEIEASRAQVQSALEDARTQLRDSATPLARDAAERILGRALA